MWFDVLHPGEPIPWLTTDPFRRARKVMGIGSFALSHFEELYFPGIHR